jgi:hypothetical protein
MRAVGHGQSCHRREILDRHRDPEEWRRIACCDAAISVVGRGASVVVVAPDQGVELRVAPVDDLQAGIEQLDRGELAAAECIGEPEPRCRRP